MDNQPAQVGFHRDAHGKSVVNVLHSERRSPRGCFAAAPMPSAHGIRATSGENPPYAGSRNGL